MYGPHWVCPSSQWCVLSGSTLLGLQNVLQGIVQSGPRSKPLRFMLSGTPQGHRLGWACVLYVSQVGAAQALCEHTIPDVLSILITHHPQSRPLGFPGGPQEHHLRCATCLLWGADLRLLPSWQMSTVQDPRKTWLETGSLFTV